jgi:hypothetical protein
MPQKKAAKTLKTAEMAQTGPAQATFSADLKNDRILRVGIKKPLVTYDIVSYYRKAVCPNLFAALPDFFPSKFHHFNLTLQMSLLKWKYNI